MKKKWPIPVTAAVIATLWFAIAESVSWWETLILAAIAIWCFIAMTNWVKKDWAVIVINLLGVIVFRYLVLDILLFVVAIWVWILGVAWSIVSWAFPALGIVGGLIVLLLVIAFIKGLCK